MKNPASFCREFPDCRTQNMKSYQFYCHHCFCVSRITSIILYHFLVNFVITDEIFVKCVRNVSGNSGTKKSALNITF